MLVQCFRAIQRDATTKTGRITMGFHVVEKDQPRKHFLLDFGKPFQVSIHRGVEAPNPGLRAGDQLVRGFNTWGRGSPQQSYYNIFHVKCQGVFLRETK